ncbi:MAG: ERAP1-like C-terminal domain-containing protein, partial [Sciscionella sp.]
SLVPTVSNKQRAWQQAVHDDELPNAINESIIMGFAHPAQRELLGEFGERYFAEVDEMWERRSSERAQPTAVGLFPSWSVSRDTVARADQWLAGEHNSSLRRMVSEGRAGVVRALAAQQFDRS